MPAHYTAYQLAVNRYQEHKTEANYKAMITLAQIVEVEKIWLGFERILGG